MDSPLIRSLRTAIAANPGDVPLRLHLAELLLEAGATDAAVSEAAIALQHDPASAEARALMGRALTPEPEQPPGPEQPVAGRTFDWSSAEQQLSDVVPPRYLPPERADGEDDPQGENAYDVEVSGIRLDDVGGMEEVKARLEAAFLAPMRNPELRKLYGKSLRGGLMLYGPPGCGKTFIARAVAGELGARFLAVTLSDVLDMWIGSSERNLHEIFQTARRSAPCVLFLDEIDALGQKRSQVRNSGIRGTVNQLLVELDAVQQHNDGVFVLAATNHPWDVDTALRRPGRLDRTLLVLLPDAPAREAIFDLHLRDRPIAGVDIDKLIKRTDGFSGADIAHICESAAERALLDSARTGRPRMISTADLLAARDEIRPSADPWFQAARNVAMFANEGGTYDELLAYLKRRRMV